MQILPAFYQTHLKAQLKRSEYLILSLLVALLQSYRWVSVEELANKFPQNILFESRRRKIQRFKSLPELTLTQIGFPLFTTWLKTVFDLSEVLYIAIDRTQWGCINLLMISLIYERRAIPIYFEGWTADEAWFILTNLPSLELALSAYQKRFGIEEMFRDFKSGGYNLEGTGVEGERLIALILLITLAYGSALMSGEKIKKKGQVKYVCRVKEPRRTLRRHSNFYSGLHGWSWVESLQLFTCETETLMALSPHKQRYYQRGKKAARFIRSTF